jgi:hypothetical protein
MIAWIASLLACTCATPPDPGLSVEEIARHVRKDADDRVGWATDVRDAIRRAGELPDEDHVCQVLAIIEQESGYDPDPAVPDLGAIAEAELDAELASLGPLSGLGKSALLDPVAEGQTLSFAERLRAVQTERDLDRLFREIVDFHQGRVPGASRVASQVFPKLMDRLNPVATAGSMQVSVAWARERAKADGEEVAGVRDQLYERRGGVRYGTARLFAHEARYDDPIYRFADYNAGFYASRNAAFQELVGKLTERELTLDGDLLLWTAAGKPRDLDGQSVAALLAWRERSANDLTERRLRADLRLEKEAAFEQTDTWAKVRADAATRLGAAPPYARLPDVSLDSPKLRKDRTTAWFAERVDARYRDCLERG